MAATACTDEGCGFIRARRFLALKESTLKKLFGSVLLAAFAVFVGPSQAQIASGKPVTLIVPTTPGTGSDIAARLVAPRLSKRLGQPVIVENRTGASGIICITAVAKAPTDRSMVLFVPNT